MKIAICSDAFFLKSNTVANHISVLLKGLSQFGHEIRVFTSDTERSKFRRGKSIVAFPGKETGSIYRQRTRLFALPDIGKALAEFEPDVIHILSLNSLGAVCARYAVKHNIPILTTLFNLNDCFPPAGSGFFAFVKAFLYKLAARYILGRSREIASFTPHAQELVEQLGLSQKVSRIPCCVDSDLFGPDTADPEKVQRFRLKFGIDSDKVGILYAGSLLRQDQLKSLFDVWSGSVRPADRLKLVLVGSCRDPEELKETIRLHGITNQVVYAGELLHEDMAACYRACDAFLSTTDEFAIHFSSLEAIACGLPALVHESCSNRYLIRDGVNGFVYKSNPELRGLLQKFASLDATGKRMLRSLVSGTMKDLNPFTQADSMEALYFAVISR